MDNGRTKWHPISELVEGNTTGSADATNEGGFIIYCTNGVEKKEFQAVAIERRHVTNKSYRRKSFKHQLRDQFEAAQAACDSINAQYERAEKLREEAIASAKRDGKLTRALHEADQAITALRALTDTLARGEQAATSAEAAAEDAENDLLGRDPVTEPV